MPPLATALALVYVPSFFISLQDTAPYKIISDELNIIVKEAAEDSDSSERPDLLDGADDGPLQELDVEEDIQYEERSPKILRTLLTGMPSPSSLFWSWLTFGINLALLAMTVDVIYRAQIFHPNHHASFARIGFVSENYANVLVREPYAYDVKVLYRSIDEYERSWMQKMLHSSQPDHWLTGDTDFTTNIKLDRELILHMTTPTATCSPHTDV